ncbi:MAG: hypothetical protein K6T88_13805 [Bacillus sp. (in: Bacteria)]|nr:hypothetical protein [Bacillus sp. (in: firmicutes)]
MDESRFYAYCLQGDVAAAYEYLCAIPNKSKKYQALEYKYYYRFFVDKPMFRYKSNDPWIRKVIFAYYQYFISVLTKKSSTEAEDQLMRSLVDLIPNNHSLSDLDSIEEQLVWMFKEKGYCFLGGVIMPYRGPFIWKTTVKKGFTVELPHQTQEVEVSFLSDFILQSWFHFSTFGEKFAAGWAMPDGLFYVNEGPKNKRVNHDSNEFQVSYLKHEAQHQSDFSRFPNLQSKDLEYRAKLVELIYEPKSLRLLKKFFYEKKNDPLLPHSYSSFVIMKQLSESIFSEKEVLSLNQWLKVDSSSVRNYAWGLFDEHTRQLVVDGEETKGII